MTSPSTHVVKDKRSLEYTIAHRHQKISLQGQEVSWDVGPSDFVCSKSTLDCGRLACITHIVIKRLTHHSPSTPRISSN